MGPLVLLLREKAGLGILIRCGLVLLCYFLASMCWCSVDCGLSDGTHDHGQHEAKDVVLTFSAFLPKGILGLRGCLPSAVLVAVVVSTGG